jgi:LuxR family quorum sensing-dependent transcriptional regulator
MSAIADAAEALAACRTLETVRDLFRDLIAPHGFTASACGAFVPTGTGPETRFFFNDWPPAWLDLYTRNNFVAADFLVAEARRRVAPFTWLEAKAARVLSRAEAELWATAVAWGWTDGLTVPIHGPGGYFGLVVLAGQQQALPAGRRGELHLMALMAHERCLGLAAVPLVAEPEAPLTPRELQCIRWVVAGKTDWEIGGILGVSQTTVKTHVDEARRKLGARTRSQAAARLVQFGLA